MNVYHYTDTARLPWIVATGELRPGANRIGGFPDPDFLWTTSSPHGDRSASASADALRAGLTRSVRFTLHADDFLSWRDAVGSYAAWTPEQVERLERAAADNSRPQDWWCCAGPLPRRAWISAESRSWTDNRWRPLDVDQDVVLLDRDTCGVSIDGRVYFSHRYQHPAGATGYEVFCGKRERAA